MPKRIRFFQHVGEGIVLLGISVNYSGARFDQPIRRILRAEELGFDSVWTSETSSSDAMSPLASIAALTKKIRLGTGIAQLAVRTPANMEMLAQTLSQAEDE